MFDQSNNTGAIDLKMDGSVLEEKSHFKMPGLTFFSKWDWGSYITCIAESASKKVGTLILSLNFLSFEVAICLYKSSIHSSMEYCCHVWSGAFSCSLEFLNNLQKRMCKTVVPSLATSLEPLAHPRNVASWSLVYRYYFGRCLFELAQLLPLRFSQGSSTRYSERLHDFSVTISRCYRDVCANSFFPRTARLWNSLPIESFPLSYDLNGFKSRINRHLLIVDFFYKDFLDALIFLCFFFLFLFSCLFLFLFPCLVVAVQPCIEWLKLIKIRAWGRILLGELSINEQIQIFDSQMHFPVILTPWIWNISATMVRYTGLRRNSRNILER